MVRARTDGGRRGRQRLGLLVIGVAAFLPSAGASARAEAQEAFRCELGQARGVSPSDAESAADLVCAELRRASGGRGDYGVELRTLGKAVVVTAARRDPAGSVTVQVDGVEEVATAAPRIADALVRGLGFETTQRVDNLLQAETRKPPVKKGSVKFTMGVGDVESPGFGARAAGFSLGLTYASTRFALPAELRFAWDDTEYPGQGLDLFSVSVGGRAYLSRRGVSPLVGGGIGVLRLNGHDSTGPGPGFYAERFGVAPYAEAGVEMMRLHRGRIALLVRADFPTEGLESPEIPSYSYYDPVTRELVEEPGRPAERRYVVPVAIGVSVSF